MAIDPYIHLDDIGLFKKARRHEEMSQYARARQVCDQFTDCMRNAQRCYSYCIMPDLCAEGAACLACAHLIVDYSNFTGRGIKLPRKAATLIDERLRATGTLVYRNESWVTYPMGSLAGDIHIPALSRISTFTGTRGTRKSTGTRKSGPAKPATADKTPGFFGRLFGLG